MCSRIVHVRVACDLVEWAEACPTTHFLRCFLPCKLHISSSVHGDWFSHWLGTAFRNADGLADSQTPLNEHRPRSRSRACKAVADSNGICSPSAGLQPWSGVGMQAVWVTHLRGAVCWTPVLSVCTEYKGYADAKLLLKVGRFYK